MRYAFIRTYEPVLDDVPYRSFDSMEDYRRWCAENLPSWLGYSAFDYRQAQEIRDSLAGHGVRYLFIGKSGAILLGFPDTTQDAVVFPERSPANGRALVAALRKLGFALTAEQAMDIERGKHLVQLKNGPFDVDLVRLSRPSAVCYGVNSG